MTLLIAWFLISGFEMHWLWYPVSFFAWMLHIGHHPTSNEIVADIRKKLRGR